MQTITAKELRLNLKSILNRVSQGEEFTVIYQSKPIAQLSQIKQESKFNFDAFESTVNEIRSQYKPSSMDEDKSFKQIYREHLDKKYLKDNSSK
jgi:antitoxin (DNA-binding transcriptional repressor) of toxin-antitoxin stability system